MPFYQKKGNIPLTRHIQFLNKKNELYYEELISRKGFSGIYSNVYHINPPTALTSPGTFIPFNPEPWNPLKQPHHFFTSNIKKTGNADTARVPLMGNKDVLIHRANIDRSMDDYFRSAHFDEVWFIQEGSGILHTNFGQLEIGKGDYVIIPRGVIWTFELRSEVRLLLIETTGPVETPSGYRNNAGQLLEHSPFCERDIRTPEFTGPYEPISSRKVVVRFKDGYQDLRYKSQPFDLVGWDGYYFPWVFNIEDFQPITGKIHQPPPVHQTFQAPGLVICSFVPRIFDYHEKAIPAPYAHSNVDSDEVLFYVKGNFMSRKGIQPESITLHPMGIPHGPQPGKIEESFGAKETNEMAVMIDTFSPLTLYKQLEELDDPSYPLSWMGE